MMTVKTYQCRGLTCTKTRQEKTNHYGSIYNIFCPVCASEGRNPLQSWRCLDAVPVDGWVPDEWEIEANKEGN